MGWGWPALLDSLLGRPHRDWLWKEKEGEAGPLLHLEMGPLSGHLTQVSQSEGESKGPQDSLFPEDLQLSSQSQVTGSAWTQADPCSLSLHLTQHRWTLALVQGIPWGSLFVASLEICLLAHCTLPSQFTCKYVQF